MIASIYLASIAVALLMYFSISRVASTFSICSMSDLTSFVGCLSLSQARIEAGGYPKFQDSTGAVLAFIDDLIEYIEWFISEEEKIVDFYGVEIEDEEV